MNDREVVDRGRNLANLAAFTLHGDVKDFLDRVDVQLAFHLMCYDAGWDAGDGAMMDKLSRTAGLLLGIYLADRRLHPPLEMWPVLEEEEGDPRNV